MDTKTANTAPRTASSAGGRPNTGTDIDIKEILIFIWKLRYYIFICAVAAVLAAWIYVRMQTPVYLRTAEVMLSDEKSGASEQSFLAEITGMGDASKIEDEMHILKSPRLMSVVAERLGLDVRYYDSHVPGMLLDSKWARKHLSLKTYEYYKDSPFTLYVGAGVSDTGAFTPGYVSVEFAGADKNTFILTSLKVGEEEIPLGKNTVCRYGSALPYAGCSIVINAVRPEALVSGGRYRAVKSDTYGCGRKLAKGLSVSMMPVTTKNIKTNIIFLSMKDTKVVRADEILNTLIDVYNEDSREFKNSSLRATVEFIDSRLRSVAEELGNVETTYRRYQESNTLVNFEAQSQMVLSSDREYENRLIDIGLQQSILKMIKDYLQEMEDEYRMIPSDIGLDDVNLNHIISEYNALVMERNRLVVDSSENHPRMQYLNANLPGMKQNIVMSIKNLEQIYGTQERNIEMLLKKSKDIMSGIPSQQYDLTQIERRQQIIEPLYLLLQQKKEEAQISMYASSDNLRLIEAPYGDRSPISPERMKIIIVTLFLGCCIPPGVSFLREYFRNTIETREDVEKVLDYPILASIPDVENPDTPVTSGGRDVKSESFRMLRSNLAYLSGRVLLVTSSVPGEGKSFVSSNLAVSISHTGKKVLLAGFDLRKPRLVKLFPGARVEKGHSVTHYLIGKTDAPEDTIVSSGLPNLDVAFSGSVPPNPSELLSTERVGELMEYYRKEYDYVVLDTAPMMLVPDSILVNRYADHTIYVLRAGYTALNTLREISRMFEEKEVRSPKLVINGLDFSSRTIRYGYGYGKYGYGYGYGKYGYGKYGYGKYGYGKYGYGKYGYGKYGYGKYGYGHGYGYGYGYGQEDASGGNGHREGHHFTNLLYDIGRIFRKKSK